MEQEWFRNSHAAKENSLIYSVLNASESNFLRLCQCFSETLDVPANQIGLLGKALHSSFPAVKTVSFDEVVRQGVELQAKFPGKSLVAIGGTASALHCEHRFSLDVGCVTPLLANEYDSFMEQLDHWTGWQTNRKNPPFLILGERGGVDLGLRQLRRSVPLRVTQVRGLTIPTLKEALRVKAFLLSERRATRDFLDFAALTEKAGSTDALNALGQINLLYPPMGSQSPVCRFAEACEAPPIDLAAVDLKNYKGVSRRFADWNVVREICQTTSRELLKRELAGKLPQKLSPDFK